MEALGINLGFFLVQVLNFLILLIILYAWAYRPILKVLDERKQKIAQSLEDARVAGEARANAEREAQRIITDAQSESAKRVREATERAEQATVEVRAAAETDAQRIRAEAAEEATAERNRLLGELRSQVAALAIAAANKVIGETLDEKRQRALIDEFFSGVRAGKITVGLDGEQVTGAAVEVVSALPLTASEQESVRRDLKGAASVNFRVDPSILGGLIIRVGDKIVDASVAGRLEGLRQAVR
jgi:F-type H+-transporting ATPase subunit b